MSSDLDLDKRETAENFIQWKNGIGFAFQKITVVAAWTERRLQGAGFVTPAQRALGDTACITI